MDRYERLYLNEQKLYFHDSGIIISAQSILKDNKTSGVIAQIKYQNIFTKVVSAVFVDVIAYDIAGNKLERIQNYQYLDLKVKRDEYFGSQVPIKLANSNARKIDILVKQVIYEDGTIWSCTGNDVIIIPNYEKISEDKGICEQAKITLGDKAEYKHQEIDNLWVCTCGSINLENEERCHRCNVLKSVLVHNTPVVLMEKLKKRLDEEYEAEQVAKEKRLAEEKIEVTPKS